MKTRVSLFKKSVTSACPRLLSWRSVSEMVIFFHANEHIFLSKKKQPHKSISNLLTFLAFEKKC